MAISQLTMSDVCTEFSFFGLRSRTQEIFDSVWLKKKIRVFVKRDDELHPIIGGNKFRKLKYTVDYIQKNKLQGIITCGGAFSNHIAATAAVGKIFGIKTAAFVRADHFDENNSTLVAARNSGMVFVFVDRKSFSKKILLEQQAQTQFTDFFWLPEGGTNSFALRGCAEIYPEICADLNFAPTHIAAAGGTGGTLAGLLLSLNEQTPLLGFHILKGSFLEEDVAKHLSEYNRETSDTREIGGNFNVFTDYHFGGYAKSTDALIAFINAFKQQHGIALDPVYTGKLFFGVIDLIQKDYFPENSSVVLLHSGGLQGIAPYNRFMLSKENKLKIDV